MTLLVNRGILGTLRCQWVKQSTTLFKIDLPLEGDKGVISLAWSNARRFYLSVGGGSEVGHAKTQTTDCADSADQG